MKGIAHFSQLFLTAVILCCFQAACQPQVPADETAKAVVRDQPEKLVVQEIQVTAPGDFVKNPDLHLPQTSVDPVMLVIKTTGVSTGALLEAKLFDLKNGKAVGEKKENLVTQGAQTTQLTFESAGGWSPGRYLVQVKVDGKLSGQRNIDIVDAPPTTTR